jgi:hypothetical protein
VTSYDAVRLAQTLYDMWFDPLGHDHDGYPDIAVDVDGAGDLREVNRVTYDEVTNLLTISTVPRVVDPDVCRDDRRRVTG